MIVRFAEYRTKRRIQNLAQEKNGLYHKDKNMTAFPDLPPEALVIRKALKSTILKLQAAKITYCWATPGKLLVIHENKYYAWDEDLGRDLLFNLGVGKLMEVENKSYKRKWASHSSPNKSSKIPVPSAGSSSTGDLH